MRPLFLVVILLPAIAAAEVPKKLAYQGRLTRSDGSPEVGAVDIVFAIYDSANTKLWSEPQRIGLTGGYYVAVLGDENPIPAGAFDGSTEKYLELSIGGTALTPRQRITSVPYAMVAGAVSGGLPASPNLLSDTLTFSSIPSGQSALVESADWGPWKYVKNTCQNASILVKDPPADLIAIVQPGTSAPRSFKVLHLTFSPGSGGTGEGRLVQQATASDKATATTMSAYVKVLSGQLFIGPEGKWQAQTASTWTRVAVTVTPDRSLGGLFGFTYQPGVLTEAYVALPKVELAQAATPYMETATPGPSIVEATCTPAWSQGNAAVGGLTLCSTDITVPWPAHINAYVSGHIRSPGGTRCTVGISINNDLSIQDLCCTPTQSAYAPILLDPGGVTLPWVPGSTHRQKFLPAGSYPVSYFIYSSGSAGCQFNGSTLSVSASRL